MRFVSVRSLLRWQRLVACHRPRARARGLRRRCRVSLETLPDAAARRATGAGVCTRRSQPSWRAASDTATALAHALDGSACRVGPRRFANPRRRGPARVGARVCTLRAARVSRAVQALGSVDASREAHERGSFRGDAVAQFVRVACTVRLHSLFALSSLRVLEVCTFGADITKLKRIRLCVASR